MLFNHLILRHPLLLFPSIFPIVRVFPNESALLTRWLKYWRFNCSISPSSQYSGLISFRIDWFDLLAVQGALKSPLQHHKSEASVLWYSAFFMVQFTHLYMITGKTIALTRWPFVGEMSLLFNMLSRFFLPRNMRLLSSWLQSPSAMILEPKKIKVCHCFHCFPIYLPWSDGTRCHDLHFWMLSFKPSFSLSSFSFIRWLYFNRFNDYISLKKIIDVKTYIF